VTDSDACFEINIIDLYIKRAVLSVYKFNGIIIINLNIQQVYPSRAATVVINELT
jgi:hypothetical protein